MKTDVRGVPVSCSDPAALAAYERALRAFQTYTGDPIALMDEGLAQAPDFVPGHLLKAFAIYTMGERALVPLAREASDGARRFAAHANSRERGLMGAMQCLLDGEWDDACRALDRVLVLHPRDALAIQVAHLMDFYRGDAQNLRNRVSRVLPHWSASIPGYSFILGMHAFGLEEMNQYGDAEATARRALELEPRDGWAVHAVTHVMEMQGRIGEGIEFLQTRERDWAPDNAFAYHNFWHMALFMLDDARYDDALALYDTRIHPAPSQYVLSLVDATALLWRLALEGVDVGARFEAVADEWQSRLDAEQAFYAFNDLHALLAFVATGRQAAAARVMESLDRAARGSGSNAAMARDVGMPLARSIVAFGAGRYADAIDGIDAVRDRAHRFGGSHAQRDLLTLTMVEAALRSGDGGRARHYLAERTMHKPASRWASRLLVRAAGGGGLTPTLRVAA